MADISHRVSPAVSNSNRTPGSPERTSVPRCVAWLRRLRLGEFLRSYPSSRTRIAALVAQRTSDEQLDVSLMDFYRYSQGRSPHKKGMRPWRQVSPKGIHRGMIVGMPVPVFEQILLVATEIEKPIDNYTVYAGDGFKYLLPNLGQFMGRTLAEQEHFKTHGGPRCVATWCAEENRHWRVQSAMLTQLQGCKPAVREIETYHHKMGEAGAVEHLEQRILAELSATGTYLVLASHSTGALHDILWHNLMGDELKHLLTVTAAWHLLMGPRHNRRLVEVIKRALIENRKQRKVRAFAGDAFANAQLFAELMTVFAYLEARVRRYMAGIPHEVLRELLDSPAKLPEAPILGADPERLAKHERELACAKERRDSLALWSKGARRRELRKRAYAQEHAATISFAAPQLFTKNQAEARVCATKLAKRFESNRRLRPFVVELLMGRHRLNRFHTNPYVTGEKVENPRRKEDTGASAA